jgi:hypothetical protein
VSRTTKPRIWPEVRCCLLFMSNALVNVSNRLPVTLKGVPLLSSSAADPASPSENRLQFTNHLINEKSPYLLQHAHNPVDWYPWGEEAFAKARTENKPIFLSVGYSTCHWCHVMEQESYSDPEIAKIMNANFVSIKVDREERPDIDNIYLTFVEATTGHGGWPMNVWLTPDLKPFVGGTYFPAKDQDGTPVFKNALLTIADGWKKRRDRIVASSKEITSELQRFVQSNNFSGEKVSRDILKKAYNELAQSFDSDYGGFGGVPKFPRPVVLNFLLHTYAASTIRCCAPTAMERARSTGLRTITLSSFKDCSICTKRLLTPIGWIGPLRCRTARMRCSGTKKGAVTSRPVGRIRIYCYEPRETSMGPNLRPTRFPPLTSYGYPGFLIRKIGGGWPRKPSMPSKPGCRNRRLLYLRCSWR